MPDSFEDEAWVKVGVAGAMIADYRKDQRAFLEGLATMLQSALPEDTEIKRRGLFTKTLAGVSVRLGEHSYAIEDPGKGGLRAERSKIVRGITLKRDEISVEECLSELGTALEEHVAKSGNAREALRTMLGLS